MRRSNDLLVGTVVLLTSVALLGATLWVKQSDIGSRRERVYARFQDVGNARVGNAAVIRGVRAGRIDAIELADDGWVRVRLSLDPQIELPKDPVLLLQESSLFGEWQATVIERAALPDDESVKRQIAAARGDPEAMPGATLPDIAKLAAVAGQIAGDVASVAGRFDVAFDESAARELRASIRQVADLSSTLARAVRTHAGDLDTLSTGLRSAVGSLQRTARVTESIAARVDSSTGSGEIETIVNDVSVAAKELRRATTQLSELSSQLAKSQAHLDRFLSNGDTILTRISTGQGTLGLLVNDARLYRNADSLLVQMRALITDMQAHPRKYVNVRIF